MFRKVSVVLSVSLTLVISGVLLSAQTAKLKTSWAVPDVGPISYAGKKVAAVAITSDMDLRMSAEEALAREISARGPQGIAAYRAIPKEVLADKDQAQQWFTKTGVAGVITIRLVDVDIDKSTEYSSFVIGTAYYQNFGSYYGYGLATVVPVGSPRETTRRTYAVETLLYDIAGGGRLLWAGLSETTDPKNLGTFVKGLATAVGNDLEKKKLVAKK